MPIYERHNIKFILQVTHKLFWTRYFFKVHLIELQENRRQILKKRAAEVASKNEKEENNWDDVADLADNPTSNTIPAEVQEKLLSEYEKELIGEKYNYANVILFWITHPWVRYPKEKRVCTPINYFTLSL